MDDLNSEHGGLTVGISNQQHDHYTYRFWRGSPDSCEGEPDGFCKLGHHPIHPTRKVYTGDISNYS